MAFLTVFNATNDKKEHCAFHASRFLTSFALFSEIIDYVEMNDFIQNLAECGWSSERKQQPTKACFPFRFHASLACSLADNVFV